MFNKKSLILMLLAGSMAYSQTKLAQTGFQFLSVGPDARAAGMGSAMTTMDWGSGALYFNPAGMATLSSSFELAVSQNSWLADITHNALSLAISPFGGNLGVFGITLLAVNYGEIEGTMVWPNEAGYIETGIQEPTALAAGIGYARVVSDRFSVGGQVKYVNQHLGSNIVPSGEELTYKKNLAAATAFDFGTLFKTGFKSLTFGMSVRNFSNEIVFESESFQLPLTFRLGLSMNLFDFLENSSGDQVLDLHIDAAHPRAFSEQMNIGLEYSPFSMLFLRGGYMVNYDEPGLTFGMGINFLGLAIDYAYWPVVNLGDVQRFTLRFGI